MSSGKPYMLHTTTQRRLRCYLFLHHSPRGFLFQCHSPQNSLFPRHSSQSFLFPCLSPQGCFFPCHSPKSFSFYATPLKASVFHTTLLKASLSTPSPPGFLILRPVASGYSPFGFTQLQDVITHPLWFHTAGHLAVRCHY